jgi:hypothetical protein
MNTQNPAAAVQPDAAADPADETWTRNSNETRAILLMRTLTPAGQEAFVRAGRRMVAGMPPREAALLAFQESGMDEAEVADAMAELPTAAGSV